MSRSTLLRFGSIAAVASLITLTSAVLSAQAKKASAGAYFTDKYPNLFLRSGHTESESQAKIEAAYQQLFHGDPEQQAVGFDAGSNANGPLMYITDWANHDVRTEGMSYGMMIAVQLDKKSDFDAIWNWAQTYMYIADPKHPTYRTLRCRFCLRRTAGAAGRESTTIKAKPIRCSPRWSTVK
jgi:oligosaccharide reducing-end xylanase